MWLGVEWMLALRYLRARRREGFVSVIAGFSLVGIALGVATLIVVLAVMNGVRSEMTGSIVGLEGHVTVSLPGGKVPDYDGMIAQLRSINGVQNAIAIAQGQLMVSANGRASGAMLTGLRQQDITSAKPMLEKAIGPQLLGQFSQGDGILLGARLAERLGVNVGDAITLISPQGQATVAGLVPRVKTYALLGTFAVGMYAYDNSLVLLPFEQTQLFLKLRSDEQNNNFASAIEVYGAHPEDAPALAQQVSVALGQPWRVYDWISSNEPVFRAVMVQRNVMFLVLTMIILVASFNIISGLVMLVGDKQSEIAILRTMGATRGQIQRVFLYCGMGIGVVGTLVGVALGLLIASNTLRIQHAIEAWTGQPLFANGMYYLSSLPSKIDAGEVVAVTLMALALSFLATLYPARKAARTNPAEALRYG